MPLQIPHPNTPLHLYRHLLREASYLPPLCRSWITSRIQTRYRDCKHKQYAKPHIQDAHHQLRYIRSANAGHADRLLHLCQLATGRVGKRRRQLVTSYLTKHPPTDTASLDNDALADHKNSTGTAGSTTTLAITSFDSKSNSDAVIEGRESDWLDNWDINKLHAIAASQLAAQGGTWPHTVRRSYDPKRALPTENSFGRPFCKRLARNKLKRHYASVLRGIMAPLPQGEWDRLKDLANGNTSDPDDMTMPPRRPVAQSILKEGEPSRETGDQNWDWMQYVTKPVRAVERRNSRTMKSLTGELDHDPRGQGRPIGVQTLGSRKLRRGIYGRIFELSPSMTQNPKSGRWSIKWGSSELKISKPATMDLDFFQGVDKDGKVPNRTAARNPARSSPAAGLPML